MQRSATIIILSILAILLPHGAVAQTAYPDPGGDKEARGYTSAVGEYFRIPPKDLAFIKDRHIPDEEIPVVCFISQRARVEPAAIVDLRMQGQSWMDISMHYGLGPEPYYVPAKEIHGSPYERTYGHYTGKPRKDWKKIYLSDDDIVNLVNLRFITEHYGCEPPDVMRMRGEGKSFMAITDQVRENPRRHRD